jgi:hypothetical protein
VPVVERREAAERASLPVRRTLAPMYRPIVAQGEERSRGPAEKAPAGRREGVMRASPSPWPGRSGQVLWWRVVSVAEEGEEKARRAATIRGAGRPYP